LLPVLLSLFGLVLPLYSLPRPIRNVASSPVWFLNAPVRLDAA
jgi:hypothetical protein